MGVPGTSSLAGVTAPCLVNDRNDEAEKFFRNPTSTGLVLAGELGANVDSSWSKSLEADAGEGPESCFDESGKPL